MTAMPCDVPHIDGILVALESHLRLTGFMGYDPFDALNSPVLAALARRWRPPGILFVQALKKFPFNIRPLLGIKRGVNPKGFGLLVSAFTRKYRRDHRDADLQQAAYFADWLLTNVSKGFSGFCWGYNFDWPNRNAFFRKGLPTVVNTCFVANGLLDLFEVTRNQRYFDAATSAGRFIAKDLNRYTDEEGICFSYTPIDTSCIHNANMLGAALLARLYHLEGEEEYIMLAGKSMNFSLRHQREDGAWYYGKGWKQRWIDSFHTGYNLLALRDYIRYAPENEAESCLEKGYRYYLDTFFTDEGLVKYYADALYPLDCHCFAHALITLTELGELSERSATLAANVFRQMAGIFWNPKGSFFCYRKNRWLMNKMDYTRWVQIWAFHALLIYKGGLACRTTGGGA